MQRSEMYDLKIILHDLKNQLQKMIAVLYLYPEEPDKMHKVIDDTSALIKLYERLYLDQAQYTTSELLKSIDDVYKEKITSNISDQTSSELVQVGLIYSLWIAKSYSLKLATAKDNVNKITLAAEDIDLSNKYPLDGSMYSPYVDLIKQLLDKYQLSYESNGQEINIMHSNTQ